MVETGCDPLFRAPTSLWKGVIHMSPLRFFTVVVVATPLFLMVGWPHPWWVTFVIALVATSAGYGVEALARLGKKPAQSDAADSTPVDRDWELRMLLKKGIASEERKDWDQAATLFQQVIERDPLHETAELASRHLQSIQKERSRGADGQ
jgi:hypothetical protein